MKTLVVLLASAILCAGNLQAIQVEWTQDAVNGFDFTMSGSGLPYDRTETTADYSLKYYGIENEHIVSPSGTWEMWVSFSSYIIGAPDFSEIWGIYIGRFTNIWSNSVNGTLYGSTSTPYETASFVDGYRELGGSDTRGFEAWKPLMTTSFTYSDYWNPSTWEWTINSVGRAPVSPAGVPDGGSTAALLGFAMAGILMFRRQIA